MATMSFIVRLPLLFHVPKLSLLRRKGILQYSIIGHMQSSAFHEKLVIHGEENEEKKSLPRLR
jgi:hypothetical protein